MKNILSFDHINSIQYENKVQLVPVAELIRLREHDRRTVYKWSKEDSDSNIEALKVSISENGITEPLKIKYHASDHKAYLEEGNHRLAAALELELEYLPAVVVTSERRSTGKAIRVKGYHMEGWRLPGYLAPSEIGIPGCINKNGSVVEVDVQDIEENIHFSKIEHQLVDIENAFGINIQIKYSESEYKKLYPLFEYNGHFYDLLDTGEPDVSINRGAVQHFDLFRHCEIDELPADYREFLIRKLNITEELTDFELVEELSNVGDEDYLNLKRVLYQAYEVAVIKQERHLFTYTSYESCYGGHMQLQREGNHILLEIPVKEAHKFQHLSSDNIFMKDALILEFDHAGYKVDLEQAWWRNMANLTLNFSDMKESISALSKKHTT